MVAHQMLLGNTRIPKLNYMGVYHQPTASAVPLVAAVPFGDAANDRIIAAVIIGFGPPTGVATNVWIQGLAASIHVNTRQAAGTVFTIASAVVPTGTSGNVQVIYPSSTSNSGAYFFVYRISGMKSSAPTRIVSDVASPFTMSATADAKSAVIAGYTVYINGGTTTTWSGTAGLVEDGDFYSGSGQAGVGSSASLLLPAAIAGATATATPANGSVNGAASGLVAFT